MIKVHLLEKIMQVVVNVSKWVANVKIKKEEQCKDEKRNEKINEKINKRMNKRMNKKMYRKNRFLKSNRDIEELKIVEEVHIQETKDQPISKSKVMKRWISFIKEENVIYLPSYSSENQQQKLYSGDNVVYIDFDSIKYSNLKTCHMIKEYHNKGRYGIKAHSRAPTYYSYI